METPVIRPDTTFTIDPTDIIDSSLSQPISHGSTTKTPASTHPSSDALAPRTYDEAILHSCQQQHASDDEKIKTLCLVDSLALQPMAIIDQQGVEQNVLTHPSIGTKLVDQHECVKPIIPSKRRYADMMDKGSLCVSCQPEVTDGLENLLHMSPYSSLLSQRQYVEISERVCNLLNSDWEFFPQMRFFTAMAFAGAIFFDATRNQALMLNTVEVYGRTKPVDIFCEPFGKLKGSVQRTSIPPTAINTRYHGLWPTTLNTLEGAKLVIGTLSSNVLVTSSMRLDIVDKPSLGGITNNFTLSCNKESQQCRIFVDHNMIEQAMTFIDKPDVHRLSDTMILSQIRAIRSKFHTIDAYILCRATGPLTLSHLHQPCSLFTLSESKRIPAAEIFRLIATSVIKHGENARLSKKQVQDIHAMCVSSSSKALLDRILELFDDDNSDLPILGNATLNMKLEDLATNLKSHLVNANVVAATYIVDTFTTFV